MGLQRGDHLLTTEGRPTPPYLTPDLPGIGGAIKRSPADFVVEELPLYEPAGAGPHVYLRVTREGLTTQAVRKRLAALLDIPDDQVGYAGLKDKHARTTQTFSILRESGEPLPESLPEGLAEDGIRITPGAPEAGIRHANKLKPGHLLGNRFILTLRELPAPVAESTERAQAILAALEPTGWPNYFGPQRQGTHGDNAEQGLALLRGERLRGKPKPWLRKLLLSAWQSALFDRWLARRIEGGQFDALVHGDVCKKTDTGGIFTLDAADDATAELPRLHAHAITFTGPMFGFKMRGPTPSSPAAQVEDALLAAAELPDNALKRARLPGARRAGRLHPGELAVAPATDGDPHALSLTFTLPKGAYATTVLRELMK